MQALPRTSQTSPVDSQRLIKEGSTEIAQRWLRAVSEGYAMSSPEAATSEQTKT